MWPPQKLPLIMKTVMNKTPITTRTFQTLKAPYIRINIHHPFHTDRSRDMHTPSSDLGRSLSSPPMIHTCRIPDLLFVISQIARENQESTRLLILLLGHTPTDHDHVKLRMVCHHPDHVGITNSPRDPKTSNKDHQVCSTRHRHHALNLVRITIPCMGMAIPPHSL